MKKILSLLGAVSLASTVSFSVVACNKNEDDKWLIIMPPDWINSDPLYKVLKTDVKSYNLVDPSPPGPRCTILIYLVDSTTKRLDNVTGGTCSEYWAPNIFKQLGYGPTV